MTHILPVKQLLCFQVESSDFIQIEEESMSLLWSTNTQLQLHTRHSITHLLNGQTGQYLNLYAPCWRRRLSRKCWEFCANHVAYVKNRLPHSATGCSHYEKHTKIKTNLHHIRVFGCAAFVYNCHPRTKVPARASPGIYLGCDDNGVYTVEMLQS
jgi:hypothetical protein